MLINDDTKVMIRSEKLMSRYWSLFHFDQLVGKPITVESINTNLEQVSTTFILGSILLQSNNG